MKTSTIIKIPIIFLGLILLYRLFYVSSGYSISIFSRQAPTEKQLIATISLNPQHAYAYQELAQKKLNTNDLSSAKAYAYYALKNNLSNGKAIAQLVTIFDQEKKTELADQAAYFAGKLWPAHIYAMTQTANHWVLRNQPEKAISAWDTILSQSYDKNVQVFTATENNIFSVFEKVALQENSAAIFKPYHINPPSWWMHYFEYLATGDNNLKAVTDFYKRELEHNKVFPNRERQQYLHRLGREHKLKEAYYLWLSSLDKDEIKQSGLIYNGSFEGDILDTEFSWRFGKMSNVRIYRDTISHYKGNYSLHVAYNTWVTNYLGYLHQLLILSPGDYTLTFQTRAQLFTQKGLVWKLYCVNNLNYLNDSSAGRHIATSKLFKGDLKWEKKTFSFTIPKDSKCPAQGLFLDTAKGTPEERRVRGDIWFDDISIKPATP